MIKFLPSYVGSKAQWIKNLQEFKGEHFVELFCGSAVLSANLAKTAVLNDLDPKVYAIMSNFDKLIVPKVFTAEDYFKVRPLMDWWKYAFCLQKMSFSGVFRYSKNGYNVPIKKTIKEVQLSENYAEALDRYKELNPIVLNQSYIDVPTDLLKDKVVILDPPYEGSQASYNSAFDYHLYWLYVSKLEGMVKRLIIFDRASNIPFEGYETRSMRVNGKHKGDTEAMFIFKESLKEGEAGEHLFKEIFPVDLSWRPDGVQAYDFVMPNTDQVELKSDYYDCNRTPNCFMELYSSIESKTTGGPWRAVRDNVKYFIYFFPKNKRWFIYDSKELVARLDTLIDKYPMKSVPNKGYITGGFAIPRDLLKDLELEIA